MSAKTPLLVHASSMFCIFSWSDKSVFLEGKTSDKIATVRTRFLTGCSRKTPGQLGEIFSGKIKTENQDYGGKRV